MADESGGPDRRTGGVTDAPLDGFDAFDGFDTLADDFGDEAAALDAADPLARWRDEFVIPEWAAGLIGSWEEWVQLPTRVGDELAPLIGAGPGEVVVHDSVSVNLYQLVHAALGLRPDRHVSRRSRRLPHRPLRGRRHRRGHRARRDPTSGGC